MSPKKWINSIHLNIINKVFERIVCSLNWISYVFKCKWWLISSVWATHLNKSFWLIFGKKLSIHYWFCSEVIYSAFKTKYEIDNFKSRYLEFIWWQIEIVWKMCFSFYSKKKAHWLWMMVSILLEFICYFCYDIVENDSHILAVVRHRNVIWKPLLTSALEVNSIRLCACFCATKRLFLNKCRPYFAIQ